MNNEIFDLIFNNKEWIFSGVGVFILTLFFKVAKQKQKKKILIKKNHNCGLVVNAGNNVTINTSEDFLDQTPLNKNKSKKTIKSAKANLTKEEMDKKIGTDFVEIELVNSYLNMTKVKLQNRAIAMLDIDNLTLINKHFSEKVGDHVLEMVARIIKKDKKIDSFGRCGDDTFYILFSRVDSDRTENFSNRILKNIKNHDWSILAPKLHVTCTIGFAVLDPSEDPQDWIIRSLEGLLKGKEQGRNVVAEGPKFLGKPWRPKRKSLSEKEQRKLYPEKFLRRYCS